MSSPSPFAGAMGSPFADLEASPEREIAPGVKIRVAWGKHLMLSRVVMEPGAVVPMHSHPNEQAGIVLAGEFDFTIGTETRRVRTGDTYFIPGGVTHGCTASAGQAIALDIFTPPREDYKK
ncbi:MAG: cupin domain-containing protein [Candidatus Methylomirabilales bacterium]